MRSIVKAGGLYHQIAAGIANATLATDSGDALKGGPGFPIWPWYRTRWITRRALILMGPDARNPPRRMTPCG
ncbi:MAG: hypothetical protein DMF90_28690 [Acidobacteria bacterium]|nr:MAG: hypothetical protein DMF90_28690 [Acidobacteriota bacterium]